MLKFLPGLRAAKSASSPFKRVALSLAILAFTVFAAKAQPTLSYTNPPAYVAGTTLTPLVPTSSGVDAVGYNTFASLTSGFLAPLGIAVDAAGNIYVADKGNNSVKEILAADGTVTEIGSGFMAPSGVAVDAAGNIYIADTGNGVVVKIPIDGSGQVSIGSGFGAPAAVAVDRAGNVYVADASSSTVFKIDAISGNTAVVTAGFTDLTGIAVDHSGNVYVSDGSGQAVYKITTLGDVHSIACSCTISFPSNVAVDAAGNVYVTDANNQVVYKIVGGKGSPVSIGGTLTSPSGVAVDAAGDVFAADAPTGTIYKTTPSGGYVLSTALPTGLRFNDTTGTISGKPTAVSPAKNYTVLAYGSGGGPATFDVNIEVDLPPAPTLSYGSPQTFFAGAAITPITPTSSSVASPAYGAATPTAPGFNTPLGLARNEAGDVFVADAGNSAVKLIPNGSTASLPVGSGFSYPEGVAVDKHGFVYVADQGNAQVYKVLPDLITTSSIGTGFVAPVSVAVDSLGNIYVADENNIGSPGTLYKILASDGSTVQVATGFLDLTAVTIDVKGNVYVADGGTSQVYKVSSAGSLHAVGGQMVYPNGLATDAAGNIYVSDGDANIIFQIPASGHGLSPVAAGFNNAGGVAIDKTGTLYVSDSNNNQVGKLNLAGGYFLSDALPAGLNLDEGTGVISGTPQAAAAAKDYTVIAYNLSGSVSAAANIEVTVPPPPVFSYNSTQDYTAGMAITPLTPSVTSIVGDLAYKAVPDTLASGLNAPYGTAVDTAGNVYFTDAANSLVQKIPAAGGTPVSIGSGFNYPTGVAVDKAGNVYVADQGDGTNGMVYKIAPDGITQTAIGTGFTAPAGVAVDTVGNVYVADEGASTVFKIDAASGNTISLFSGFNDVTGVATNGNGDLYITDGGISALYKLPATGGIPIAVSMAFSYPTSVAVDASGNVFVTDADDNTLYKMVKGIGSPVALNTNLQHPDGVAVDGKGKIYVSDTYSASVLKIMPTGGYFINTPMPSGLSLSGRTGTISGTPRKVLAATNYTVTGYNISGSAASTFSIAVHLPPPPTLSYAGPQSYPTNAAIAPLLPASTNIAAPGFSSDITRVDSTIVFPQGIAVDNQNNIYVASTADSVLYKIPAAGGHKVLAASGFISPSGVTADALGNIYVSDIGDGSVKKLTGGHGTPVAIGTDATFSQPAGIASDASGNVYVADQSNSAVYKIPADNSGVVTLTTDILVPTSVAVDKTGTVFVTDFYTGHVFKLIGGVGSPVDMGYSFNFPEGIVTDAAGNVYVTDTSVGIVQELPVGGGPAVTISGFGAPFAPAIDNSGNLLVTDIGDNSVKKIKPGGGYFISPALSDGLSIDNATGIISGTPTIGKAATDYTITAYNFGGSISTTLNITVLANANLADLSLDAGTLTPTFDANTTSYTSSVSNATTSVKVTPTVDDPAATVQVNGVTVASGTGSASIPLSVGSKTIKTIVRSADGSTLKTYTLVITRVSNNANMSDLAISSGTLSPAFDRLTQAYTASVTNDITSIQVTPTSSNSTALITVNGVAVTSGSPSANIALATGPNYIRTVLVSQSGTVKTYNVLVTRAFSTDATLSNLSATVGTLNPVFSPAVNSYTINVPFATPSIKLSPVANDAGATITVNGTKVVSGASSSNIALATGNNTITVSVTAQDKTTTNDYIVTVARASSNANLSNLAISGGTLSPAFDKFTQPYTASVTNDITSIQVTPTSSDAAATITVNGLAVASGSPSTDIALATGNNYIRTVVVAQDGTVKTYNVVVTRVPSSDATLSNITATVGSLSPDFSPGVTGYTINVPPATPSIKLTATAGDAGASIKINGTKVISGVASNNIVLATGNNTITISVTAQDKIATNTYTVTVVRSSSNANLSNLTISEGTLSPAFDRLTTTYTATVDNAIASIQLTPTTSDAAATLTVGGATVTSGSASPPVALVVGDNTILTKVTAFDGTIKTYKLTVTRSAPTGFSALYQPQGVEIKSRETGIAENINVHQAVSPNGDGQNDILIIEGLAAYPDNNLVIIDRNGQTIFEAKGYDNTFKVFDGHSSRTGKMQQAGTYFYSLEYKDGKQTKRKTGYIVLKY